MGRSLLIPVTGLHSTTSAIHYSTSTENIFLITLIHVIPLQKDEESIRERIIPEAVVEYEESIEKKAAPTIKIVKHYADEHKIPLDIVTEYGNPANQIAAYAAENDVDCIVIGTHGRTGLSRLLFGSISEKVIRQTTVPTTVVPYDYHRMSN